MKTLNITKLDYFRHFGFLACLQYRKFRKYVIEKAQEEFDLETEIKEFKIRSSWRDSGGNKHVTFSGTGKRKEDKGNIGAEIVYLNRSRSFRGGFWSQIKEKSDFEYFSLARDAFYKKDYSEFFRLSDYVSEKELKNPIYKKMFKTAEKQMQKLCEQGIVADPTIHGKL